MNLHESRAEQLTPLAYGQIVPHHHIDHSRVILISAVKSVRELIANIERYVENHNAHASPFNWTATAESIFAKLKRLSSLISGTQH
jgi:hypothetical protein